MTEEKLRRKFRIPSDVALEPVEDVPGLYIDDRGEAYSVWRHTATRLKPRWMGGFRVVEVMRDGQRTTRTLHHLVAECFVPWIEGTRFVRHKNGDRRDNRAENLAWTASHYGIVVPKETTTPAKRRAA